MLKLKRIAITGGLSCGKSSVCQVFKELGAFVVSADEIVHELLSPAKSLGQQIISLLGSEIVKDGKIDRSVIAQKVFKNKKLLHSLEKLIHPIVLNEIEKKYQEVDNQGNTSLFIVEIPLLFEVGAEKDFDAVIVVQADEAICKKRFTTTGYEEKEFIKRMANQMPIDEKAKCADYIIENSGNLEQMRHAVVEIFIKLTASIPTI